MGVALVSLTLLSQGRSVSLCLKRRATPYITTPSLTCFAGGSVVVARLPSCIK